MGMKIGIFDSGLGGLSVLNEALSKLSEHEFLYYADVKNVPYGQKSRDEILKFSKKGVSKAELEQAKKFLLGGEISYRKWRRSCRSSVQHSYKRGDKRA